jgi:hypothetical protein
MTKPKASYLISFILIWLCTSCADNSDSYFPLTKGLKWQYDVTLITRDGLSNQKYMFNNLGEGELKGEPAYLRESIDGTVSYYSLSEEGTHYLGNLDTNSYPPVKNEYKKIILPKDIIIGTTWQDNTITKLLQKTGPPQKTLFKIIANVPLDVKIESLDDSVTVPAGKFENCLKVSMSGSIYKDAGNYVGLTVVSVKQSNWYAPGIGLVKMERIETTERQALDKGTLLVELTHFKPG